MIFDVAVDIRRGSPTYTVPDPPQHLCPLDQTNTPDADRRLRVHGTDNPYTFDVEGLSCAMKIVRLAESYMGIPFHEPDLTQAGGRSKTARPLVASSRGRALFRRHFTSAVRTVSVRNPSLTGVVATHGRAGGLIAPDHEGGAAIMSPILPELVESRRTAFPWGSARPANSAATLREPRGKVAIPIVPP